MREDSRTVDLTTIGGGAAVELFEHEMNTRVLPNLVDPK